MKCFDLSEEVALITGGGSGLGLGVARCFVEAGARVVLAGRREEILKRAVEDLGEGAEYRVFDVTSQTKGLPRAEDLVDDITQNIGPVSILVNNAGVHLKKLAVETTDAEFRKVFDTHVFGAFALTRAALKGMVDRRHGSVVFMASMASLFGIPQVVAYSSAKSAYLGLVRTLAVEVSGRGVRVNAIAPGWIESDMMGKALNGDPARKQRILDRTPMGRFGRPEDIGRAAVYLCSPAGSFVTGAVLPVDGGISIGF
jgi:NAD(P)-dependent dehydrogenase (short-subunit alcohol dehydrogenase family)